MLYFIRRRMLKNLLSPNIAKACKLLRKLRHQLVADSADAILELLKVLRTPVRMLVHSVGNTAWEGDVENVGLVMSVVACDPVTKASSRQGDGCFANEWWAIVTILVTPDAVKLKSTSVLPFTNLQEQRVIITIWLLQTTAMTLNGLTP